MEPDLEPDHQHLYSSLQNIENQNDLDKAAVDVQQYFMVLSGLAKQMKLLSLDGSKQFRPNRQENKQRLDPKNPLAIRWLYRDQEHRAVQEILFGPSFYCPIKDKIVEKFYKLQLSKKIQSNISTLQPSLWTEQDPQESHNEKLIAPFTSFEVRQKLKMKIYCKLSNSKSVGLDRVKFRDLLKRDPTCKLLTALFNACLQLQSVPQSWKETYSVLIKIPRDLDPDDPDITKWKPVTMMNTIPKLFQALLASRLILWAQNTGRLSPMQKSILLTHASCEGSFLLQECHKYAQAQGKELSVAWLDFRDANNSISQEAVIHALQRHKVPVSIIQIIEEMIIGAKTRFRVNSEKMFTNFVEISKGLPSGAPLNPILLLLFIEPILRGLSQVNQSNFKIFKEELNHFAIPEEITLIASSQAELQNLLDSVEENSQTIGLKFNIDKCSSYHYGGGHLHQVPLAQHRFCNQTLQTISHEKIEQFFGVRQGLSIGQTEIPSIEETIESIAAVSKSNLDDFQKLESIHTFILPRLKNCLRGLQDVDETYMDQVDQILRNKIRSWLDLLDGASNESLTYHTFMMIENNPDKHQTNQNQKQNGTLTAFIPMMDLFSIMKIVHACDMLNASDKMLKRVAHDSLINEVSKLTGKSTKETKKSLLASFLDGRCEIANTSSTSLWKGAREATGYLAKKICISWRFEGSAVNIYLKQSEAKNWQFCSKAKVADTIKHTLVQFYVQNVSLGNTGSKE